MIMPKSVKKEPSEIKKAKPRVKRKGKQKEEDMPYYQWQDKNTEKTLDVIRKISDIEIAPDKDECLAEGFTVEEFAEADWTREISTVQFIGEKGKGNWARN